jgi:hypothetical protein
MLTDGQRTTGVDPLEAAKWAADRGVRVYTVGVGTVQGETIGFEGWSMRVRLDEETLKAVALQDPGRVLLRGTAADLKKVYETLSREEGNRSRAWPRHGGLWFKVVPGQRPARHRSSGRRAAGQGLVRRAGNAGAADRRGPSAMAHGLEGAGRALSGQNLHEQALQAKTRHRAVTRPRGQHPAQAGPGHAGHRQP